jgi:hypothetical protein
MGFLLPRTWLDSLQATNRALDSFVSTGPALEVI